MNFLLHREWALRETGDPVLASASMLPDLWRMVERRARLGSRHFRIDEPTDSATRGLVHHLTTDRWFHDDPLFTEGEQATVRAVQEAGVRSEKMILFAHPLWELCLDGALVRALGWDYTQQALADARVAAGGAAAEAIAESAGLSRLLPEQAARTAFSARLESLWDALQEGRWIAAYTTPHGLAECMVRMRQRVGFGEVASSDRARLERAIATLEGPADAAIAARLPTDLPRQPDPAR
jgi:hypothetical protein